VRIDLGGLGLVIALVALGALGFCGDGCQADIIHGIKSVRAAVQDEPKCEPTDAEIYAWASIKVRSLPVAIGFARPIACFDDPSGRVIDCAGGPTRTQIIDDYCRDRAR
jgi:hypothetical protein